jgi:hypothetical protein
MGFRIDANYAWNHAIDAVSYEAGWLRAGD